MTTFTVCLVFEGPVIQQLTFPSYGAASDFATRTLRAQPFGRLEIRQGDRVLSSYARVRNELT